MKKGFVLTMDVMLALVVSAVFISAIMYFVTSPKLKSEEYLYSVGEDFLTVADKDGSIMSALGVDFTQLDGFMDEMPENLCMNLSVTDTFGQVVSSRGRGCPEPGRYVLSKRTIVNGTHYYIANLRAWYR